ncbi:MAG: di-trans,poly-cis-decaprenylcistransferase [Acidobacteriota bacterium]|nr:MAG: di-trans,poly-cis-decaprenylcistransferase [Acidobacteriota bacterium]
MADLFENFREIVAPDSPEADLLSRLDPSRLPRHIAIIMDGNGRWAEQRGLPRVEGHRAGSESVKAAIEYSARLGIKQLTLYAFSAENWKRPVDEVNTLWTLLRTYLRRELSTLMKHEICFRAIGRLSELQENVRSELVRAEKKTAKNTRMNLVIALNYSGRLELVDACNSILRSGVRTPVTEADLADHLYTAGLPDPDLMIRTSGEQRLSNFLLWQVAYSEIYFCSLLWPDFRGKSLLEAVLDFQKRDRRYGGIRTTYSTSTP